MTKLLSISEIAIINGCSVTSKDNFEYINYLDTSNLTRNKIGDIQLLKKNFPSRAKRKVNENTILYSTVRPNQEHYGILEKKDIKNLIVSTGFVTIDVFSKEVNPKYLFYKLTQPQITRYLQGIAENSVSAYPSIKPEAIGNINFKFPNLTSQQTIASVLSALDDKIELNNKINAELEQMAKTLYDYWFVQFDFPNEEGKPYKSSGGKMVYNNVLKREIPEGWGDKSLREICYVNSKQVNSKYEGKYINYLDTSNITKNKLGEISNFHVSRRPSRAQRLVDKDDIIYSTVRPIQQHFGILKMPLDDMVVSTGFTVLSHKQNSKFNDVLYMYLSSDEIIIRLQNIAQNRVSSYPSISADDILSLSMPWPLEENSIMLIAEQLGRCHEKIHLNQRQNKELSQLRDWLLPMLMNGQVKVSDNYSSDNDEHSIVIPKEMDLAAEPTIGYQKLEPFVTNESLEIDPRFESWLAHQGLAARGDIDTETLREIFDAMDDEDK